MLSLNEMKAQGSVGSRVDRVVAILKWVEAQGPVDSRVDPLDVVRKRSGSSRINSL